MNCKPMAVRALKAMSKYLINGIAADYLHASDRTIHYGDGLFETVLCHADRLYYWPQHYSRLQQSAEKLQICCPHENVLLNDINKLLSSGTQPAAIKIILSRGCSERGYRYTQKQQPTRITSLNPLPADYSSLLNRQLAGGELFVCRQQVSINKNLAGLKHLNRLENVLARNEFKDEYIDGLMLNNNNHVIEGTMSNLFAVKNAQLYTPELDLCGVTGIMREQIMQAAEHRRIPLSVVRLTLEDLLAMDELFISNSLIGMSTVSRLAERVYTSSEITATVFNELLSTMDNYAQPV